MFVLKTPLLPLFFNDETNINKGNAFVILTPSLVLN